MQTSPTNKQRVRVSLDPGYGKYIVRSHNTRLRCVDATADDAQCPTASGDQLEINRLKSSTSLPVRLPGRIGDV